MTVSQRQALLFYLGYYTGPLDGDWGKASRVGCKEFQRSESIPADGLGGPVTDGKLLEAVAAGRMKQEAPEQKQTAEGPDWWKEIRYFRRDEPGIFCPCGRCGGYPVEPSETLMRLADRVRTLAGAPATVSSTVRCAAHNAELKGSAPNSRHLQGRAMDFSVRGWSSARLLALVKQQKEVHYAYAIDGSFVHMDV